MINETNFRVDVDGADPRVREVCAVHGEDIRFTAQFYRRGVAVALAGAATFCLQPYRARAGKTASGTQTRPAVRNRSMQPGQSQTPTS